jgi:25S rRNA (uracil2843-N3)-methyltransferase
MAPNRRGKHKQDKPGAAHQTATSQLPPARVPDVEPFAVPLEVQQSMLNSFARGLSFADAQDLILAVQQVKGHLYQRDFASAFSSEDKLKAYAVRWSASRAIGYAEVFVDLGMRNGWDSNSGPTDHDRNPDPVPEFICLGGGGGAELVASAAMARELSLPALNMHIIDVAAWDRVISDLAASIAKAPPLHAYASESAKTANKPLLASGVLQVRFTQKDLLTSDTQELQLIFSTASVVTLMFTLNELFTSSISKTTTLLLTLTDVMVPGSWLLVVDSPGSYSEVALGPESHPRKYPLRFLLDHTLLEVAGDGKTERIKWRKHVTNDSKWFRASSALKYPIDLENMRYQIHLFERLGESQADELA